MNKKTELKCMMIISNEFLKITKISDRSVLTIDGIELIPVVVNCTFSIELALKCLYYANNFTKANTGHNIKKIYGLSKKYGLEEYLLKDFTNDEIDKILDELETAFADFRYLYEQKKSLHITPSLLKDFAIFVNAYCIEYLKNNFDIIF